MLPPSDAAVARRDPALPGLPVLLDDTALGDWLSQRLEREATVHGRYLRYKHGTSCVLVADLVVGATERSCIFSVFRRTNLVKVRKTLRTAPPGAVLGTDPTLGLLAVTPAGDRDLPALALLDDEERRVRALGRLLDDGRGLLGVDIHTVRHNPHRRWVGVVRPPGGAPAVLRAYRPESLARATHAIRAWGDGAPTTPRLLGALPRRGLCAVEFLPGHTLAHHRNADAAEEYAAAGFALAQLHARDRTALHAAPIAGWARAARAAGHRLADLLPETREDVQTLAGTVACRLSELDPVHDPVHGDFSADQVVVRHDGTVGLIDLDQGRLGDPAEDLACAAAALRRDVALGRVPPAAAERRLGALYAGYASRQPLPAPDRLAAHTAAHLLRRATEPFRLRLADDWPAAARSLVADARSVLESPSLTGPSA